MSFRQVERDGITLLVSPLLQNAGVLHGFTTRLGGVSGGDFASLNLRKSCGDEYENVAENYNLLAKSLGFVTKNFVMSNQVHGREVRRAFGGEGIFADRSDCDALVSDSPEAALVVFTADCVPILMHDVKTGAVAAVHAGWRGTALGTPVAAVERMSTELGTDPSDLIAAIGPCIERDCYEVDGEVASALINAFGDDVVGGLLVRRGEKWFPDLRGLNRRALLGTGVRAENIDVDDHCTKCRADLFWSHRRNGDRRGVHGAVIKCK